MARDQLEMLKDTKYDMECTAPLVVALVARAILVRKDSDIFKRLKASIAHCFTRYEYVCDLEGDVEKLVRQLLFIWLPMMQFREQEIIREVAKQMEDVEVCKPNKPADRISANRFGHVYNYLRIKIPNFLMYHPRGDTIGFQCGIINIVSDAFDNYCPDEPMVIKSEDENVDKIDGAS